MIARALPTRSIAASTVKTLKRRCASCSTPWLPNRTTAALLCRASRRPSTATTARSPKAALVHWRLEGKPPPNPRPLSASRLAPDGFRASGRQHPVQDRHTNGRFGLLGHKSTGSQPRSDQRLVAAHCRFDERPLAVSSRNLPSQASLFRDHLQVAVTLCRCTQFAAWDGRRARWDYHLNAIAVRRNRLVSGVTVIRTIGHYLGNRAVNLIEERPYLGWIVGVLIRQCLRHDHAAGRVDRQMQLAPLPARLRAMFASNHWPAP